MHVVAGRPLPIDGECPEVKTGNPYVLRLRRDLTLLTESGEPRSPGAQALFERVLRQLVHLEAPLIEQDERKNERISHLH